MNDKREFTFCQLVERSLHKKYRKDIWNPFIAAVKRYELIQPGDRIAVCVSGGKDSMLLSKLMQLYQRIDDVPFQLTFLMMDPGYSPENRRRIEENAARLEIPLTVFETDVFEAASSAAKSPCYLCARMRRGHLYSRAQALGCNKIALGHHFSDVIETTLLGMMYGGQLQGMPPKLKAKNFPGMELIRPLYTVREDDICAWRDKNNLQFIQCACRLTEQASREEHVSKRLEVKRLIKALHAENPTLEWNIFGSIHNVQLDTMVGWKYKGKEISFLDDYDEPKGETNHGI